MTVAVLRLSTIKILFFGLDYVLALQRLLLGQMERVLEEAKLAVLQLPKSFRVGSCVRFCPGRDRSLVAGAGWLACARSRSLDSPHEFLFRRGKAARDELIP